MQWCNCLLVCFVLLSSVFSGVSCLGSSGGSSDDENANGWEFLKNEPSVLLSDVRKRSEFASTDPIEVVTDMMVRVFGNENKQFVSLFELQLLSMDDNIKNKNKNNLILDKMRQRKKNNMFENDHPIWSRANELDIFELDYNNQSFKIIIRGNNAIALASGFNWYVLLIFIFVFFL